jgi:hypothetical protein
MMADFREKNLSHCELEQRFAESLVVEFLPEGTNFDGETTFFGEMYPDALGLNYVSRVGFNSDETMAVVYVLTTRGLDFLPWSKGEYIFLTLTPQGWYVTEKIVAHIT